MLIGTKSFTGFVPVVSPGTVGAEPTGAPIRAGKSIWMPPPGSPNWPSIADSVIIIQTGCSPCDARCSG